MSVPVIVTMSIKKLNENKYDFDVLVAEMEAAAVPSMEQVNDWRSRWTRYVSIQALYLTRLREDMENYGVGVAPDLAWQSDEMVDAVRRSLWPQSKTAVSEEA